MFVEQEPSQCVLSPNAASRAQRWLYRCAVQCVCALSSTLHSIGVDGELRLLLKRRHAPRAQRHPAHWRYVCCVCVRVCVCVYVCVCLWTGVDVSSYGVLVRHYVVLQLLPSLSVTVCARVSVSVCCRVSLN